MKWGGWILSFVLLFALAVCFFSKVSPVIDKGITASHQGVEIERLQNRSKLIARMAVDLAGVNDESEVRRIIRKKYSLNILKEENNLLFVDDIGLAFVNGKISEIVFYDEVGSERLR